MNLPPIPEEETSTQAQILFHEEDISFALPNELDFINWIQTVIESESCHLQQLNYIFCSDAALLKVNLEYLDHDTYTDIITFPYASTPNIEGDIFISIDRIRDNASKFDQPFNKELMRVMIHGVLHLCGYGDKSEDEKKVMRAKEDEAIALFPVA
ncbi:MAG: rRNA maturation RNase YbeY [Saprospiraceae bacterium]|nr:rRNA maturation RNase YbeY [Saprospiraceae bacterium]